MNQMETEREDKIPCTERLTHVPCGLCVHSTFAYRDVLDPLKKYHGKDCVEKSIEDSEDEFISSKVYFHSNP